MLGFTALHYAVLGSHRRLEQSASIIRSPDSNGLTPLHLACTEPRLLELFRPSQEQTLQLAGLKLTRLAYNFPKIFPSLTSLDLSHNELKDLPQALVGLTSLTALKINGNRNFQLPTSSLADLRLAMQNRMAKSQAKTVSVVLAGNGSRSWIFPDNGQSTVPLQKLRVAEPDVPKQLRLITSLNPVVRELTFCARAMYLVTVSLLAPNTSDIGSILRKITAVGLRTSPPVWIVGTDAERATPVALEQVKSSAAQQANKHSLNYIGFFAVDSNTDSFAGTQNGRSSPLDQSKALRVSLFLHTKEPIFAQVTSRWGLSLLNRLLAGLKHTGMIKLSALERLAEPIVVEQLINKATEIGRLVLFQRTVFHHKAVARAVASLSHWGKLRLSHGELQKVLRWHGQPNVASGASCFLAFLSHLGILIPHSKDGYIVPSNASDLPFFPRILGAQLGRKYKFAFAFGLARRLLAALAHFPDGKLFANAVLFYQTERLIGSVQISDTRWVFRVESSALPLFLKLVDCAETLLMECTLRTERATLQQDGSFELLDLANQSATPERLFPGLPAAPFLPQLTQLGVGGQGTIHTASWDGRLVAVKQFRDAPPHVVAREIRLAFSLRHPNLVAPLGVIPSTPPALVMELFPAQDLWTGFRHPDSDLEDRRIALAATLASLDKDRALIMKNYAEMGHLLPDWNARAAELESHQDALRLRTFASDLQHLGLALRLQFVLDVAKALAALHSAEPPILHNDVRSPNVFVVSLEPDAPVHCKLGDFGLAHRLYGSSRLRLQTWQWLAPEVLLGRDFDLASDIFSFGVVIWELLHGPGLVAPYEDQPLPPQVLKDRIIYDNLRLAVSPAVHERFSEEPAYRPLLAVMAQCWRSEPSQRPTARRLVHWLQQLLLNGNTAQILDETEGYLVTSAVEGSTTQPSAVGPVAAKERPLAEQLWWRASAMSLAGQAPGTFYVRPSSWPNSYAVEFVDNSGRTQKSLVVPCSSGGYSLNSGLKSYASVQRLIEDIRGTAGSVLRTPLKAGYAPLPATVDVFGKDGIDIPPVDLPHEPAPTGAGDGEEEEEDPESIFAEPADEEESDSSEPEEPSGGPDEALQVILSVGLAAASPPGFLPWRQLLDSIAAESSALSAAHRHLVLLRLCARHGLPVTPSDYQAFGDELTVQQVQSSWLESPDPLPLLTLVDDCTTSPHVAPFKLTSLVAAYNSIIALARCLYPPAADDEEG